MCIFEKYVEKVFVKFLAAAFDAIPTERGLISVGMRPFGEGFGCMYGPCLLALLLLLAKRWFLSEVQVK